MQSFLYDGAPQKGYILAYYPHALVFEPYEMKDGNPCFAGMEAFAGEEPRECHLFDDRTECRIIKRESAGDTIRLLLTREEERAMDSDLLFEEEVFVKPQYANRPELPGTLRIINRYRYAERDVLTLENYRISCLCQKGKVADTLAMTLSQVFD